MNFAPVLFVMLWSTGFVGAKYGLPFADPFIFLAIRVIIAAAILYATAAILREKIALSARDVKFSTIVGLTLHFAYLGGVFYAISKGMPAGIAATVTSLQPILVSAIGIRVLKEPIKFQQAVGLVLGFLGVSLVLSPSFSTSNSIPAEAVIAILIALCGSTTATLAQKKSGGTTPLLSGTAFQYLVSGAGFLIAAIVSGGFTIRWTGKFIFSLVWLILALSVGAILILLTLLKHGSASKVSSLFYLVPPATAIEAYFLFDERLTTTDFLGIGLTAFGVYLVIKNQNRAR